MPLDKLPLPSDLAGLDGDTPLSAEERMHLRRLLRDDDRATWLRKQLRIFIPLFVSIIGGLYALINWAITHYKT